VDTLVTRDSKGKIRVVEIDGRWDDETRCYHIYRTTYQYGGKKTEQPVITIDRGKAKRTVTEQFKLEYNSHIKRYTDKGYKLLPKEVEGKEALEAYMQEIMPDGVTDANGFKKHMLAKPADSVATKTFDSIPYWYGSRKIDGVRLSLYWQDDHIETASRGGQKYTSIDHITKNPKLIEFFKKHPDYVLDGELYKHGLTLQQISGLARQEKQQSPALEYYIYDLMDANQTFEDRLEVLESIKEELNLSFEPEREWEEGDLKLQMVPHEKVTGWLNIEKMHNRYVKEGWEGLVIRDPSKKYTYGGRTKDMIKVKMYKDDCFTVVGKEGGLRGAEDMVFILVTKDGKTFKAKPFGDKATKQEYWDNFETTYKGHIGECKFFYYSNDGIPLQPSFKAFRFDIE